MLCCAPLTSAQSLRRLIDMKIWSPIGLLLILLAVPSWSGAAEPFDPDQPFNQALTNGSLRSLLNQALDVLDDHVEITGFLNPDSKQGDQLRYLKFRFYPKGKSQSSESVTAEGWLDSPAGSSQQDFHFRFSLPKSAETPQSPLPDHIL